MNLSRVRDLRLRLIHLGELPWSEDLAELLADIEDALESEEFRDTGTLAASLQEALDHKENAEKEIIAAEADKHDAEARLEEYLQATGQDPKAMVARVIRSERTLKEYREENVKLREQVRELQRENAELAKPRRRRKTKTAPVPDNVVRPNFVARDPVRAYELYTKAGTLDEDPKTFDEAERLYREALRLDPTLSLARTNLANIYHRRGHVDEALRMYEESYRADPSEPCAIYNLGYCYMGREEWGRAEQYMREAITKCRPASESDLKGDALYNLAVCLDSLGKVDEARQVWKDVAKAQPPDSEWANRARSRLRELGVAKPKFEVIRGEKRS